MKRLHDAKICVQEVEAQKYGASLGADGFLRPLNPENEVMCVYVCVFPCTCVRVCMCVIVRL